MGENILVKTEYLKEKEEWKDLLIKAQRAYQEAGQRAEKLEECFCCKETAIIRKNISTWKEEGVDAFGRFMRHIDKLRSMALLYEEAERDNVNVTLPN